MKIKASAIRRLVSIGLVVILIIFFFISTDNFLDTRNIFLLLKDAGYLGLIACGLSIVMIGGGIDLSVGGIVCFTAILLVRLSLMGIPGYVVMLLAILIGGAFGVLNGFLVTKVGLTEFVTTLASGIMFTGLGLIFAFRDSGKILQGMLLTKQVRSQTYRMFGDNIGGTFYIITIAWIVLTILMMFILYKTKFGLYTFAIGSNDKAAGMSGVNTKFIKLMGFVISGAFAGLAAFFIVADNGTAVSTLGTGDEFKAIAACVVGGVVLGGGKGDSVSAFVGALFMIIILNGLYKFPNMPPYWTDIGMGAIIILATAFDAQFAKFAYKRRMTEQRLSAVA